VPVTVVEPLTVLEPTTVTKPVTVLEPGTVLEHVTVLNALEHMFASCSMRSSTFEAILNETKMTAAINNS